ncbi:MAG TPA: (2Fe-2S)-binding protein [Chloroflexota bacterium]|nr:(2Fe-2S)-binding protein [Chloroflexota bacterium]
MTELAGKRPSWLVPRGPGKTTISLIVNGAEYNIAVQTRRTLLEVLRSTLSLTGTKNGCGMGQCGACTVLLDGVPVYACLILAIECEGHRIETIEGLEKDGKLHPIQEAFIEEDAFQCGYCTSGQIMAIKGLLDNRLEPTLDEVKRAVSGNLCRCGAYPNIFRATLRAAERMGRRR